MAKVEFIGETERDEMIAELELCRDSILMAVFAWKPNETPPVSGLTTENNIIRSIVHIWRDFRHLNDAAALKYDSRYGAPEYPDIRTCDLYELFTDVFAKFVENDKHDGPYMLTCRIEDGSCLIIRRVNKSSPRWPFALYSLDMPLAEAEQEEFTKLRDQAKDRLSSRPGLKIITCTLSF